MTKSLGPLLAAVVIVAVACLGIVGGADARRIEMELGVGGFLAGDSEVNNVGDKGREIENSGLALGFGVAIELNGSFDLEMSISTLGARDGRRMDGDDLNPDLDSFRSVDIAGAGLRWYPFAKAGKPGAGFIAFGGARVSGLDEGKTINAIYLTPGVRIQAGEKSALLLKMPLIIPAEGTSHTLVIPTLSWVFQFN